MQVKASSPEEYMEQLPTDRQEPISKLREILLQNLPTGFEEVISYGMLGYVVPHAIYANGYHCDPSLPLPFINLASQKNYIALYHMGLYADKNLLDWFIAEYPKHSSGKLDMGKSCIRFKKLANIPYALIGELAGKMTSEEWIKLYEKAIKR